MTNIALICLLIAAVAVAVCFAVAWGRARSSRPGIDTEAVIDRVVKVAARTFETHLEIGKAHLVHQRDIIDEKWGGATSKVTEELAGLRRLVAELQKERAAQHEGLAQNLRNTAHQQSLLLDSTRKLNDILANKQARGQWGERMTEDILRAAGLVEGVNYLRQETTAAGTRPDFTFLMPDGRVLHMDVKFPLEGYARYLKADTEPERKQAARDFGTAVRRHVKETASRDDYRKSITTVGYVLMFIPNDGVYAFIHERHPTVFEEALKTRVVICSPSTLFAMLSLVRQAMDTIAMEHNSQEILDHLSTFTEQWGRYVEQFDLVGRHLGRLNAAFGELSTTRRSRLERQLDRIEQIKSRSAQETLAFARSRPGDVP